MSAAVNLLANQLRDVVADVRTRTETIAGADEVDLFNDLVCGVEERIGRLDTAASS